MSYEEFQKHIAQRRRREGRIYAVIIFILVVVGIGYQLRVYIHWSPEKVKAWKQENEIVCNGLECTESHKEWQLKWDPEKKIWVPK